MSNEYVSHGTAENFADAVVAQSHRVPVLVDFWAGWCAPCRALAPILDELAARHQGALRVVKVDSDAEPALAAQFGVRSLPTLLLFRDGAAVQQAIGAQPLAALERLIEPYLPRATDEMLAEAQAARARGQLAQALAQLEEAHVLDATDYRVHFALAAIYLELGRIEPARALLALLPANLEVGDEARPLKARISLADAAHAVADDEVGQAYRAAVASAVAGDLDTAVDGLLVLLARHRDWHGGAVRKALLDVFAIVPADDSRLKAWRTRMARTLN